MFVHPRVSAALRVPQVSMSPACSRVPYVSVCSACCLKGQDVAEWLGPSMEPGLSCYPALHLPFPAHEANLRSARGDWTDIFLS
ncbi:hypothetical protein STEG23_001299 [Scotinomys teguina]